ncbi:coproporphyrinogen dehydrogenase HemZ [Abyssisolibacter fermentans]|uniref:coproporphyrinogen dehydrogenase HemZ n=1 Tax=Abyssisolibacter fermentans TaxID=1766203 RepID=UPI00082C4C1F|nr:coproporphyrinogen dehydrogenase HemZ [Abyssisolibacter fermentans]
MIYIKLIGHDFKYEVFELLRSLYKTNDIQFVDKVINEDLYIESIIQQEFNPAVFTKIFKDSCLITENKISNLSNTFTHIDNIKKKSKIAVKKSILKAIVDFEGQISPWGILTGIRPTKIVHSLMDRQLTDKEIYDVLDDIYMISNKKSNLLLDVCKQERKYLTKDRNEKYSIYTSIPFCPTRCVYCSFPSNSIDKFRNYTDKYVENLIYEIEKTSEILAGKKIDTIYLGGGTPTSLSVKQLDKIICTLKKYFGKNKEEFTVEAGRPDTITNEMLKMLKNNNIDRISINPQTMCDETLSIIGRKHTGAEIIRAFNNAREYGFDNINMDLIVGLPGEGVKQVEKTMSEVSKLMPDNLTIHTLAIKRASKLRGYLDRYPLADGKTIEKMIEITQKWTYEMNMKPYYMYRQKQMLGNFENVGYCKPEKECIYNIMIMEERQSIIALGAGGVSKIVNHNNNRIERVPNVKDVYEYLKRTDEMVERKRKALTNILI